MRKILVFLVSLVLCASVFSAPSAAIMAAPGIVAATVSSYNNVEHNRRYHNSTIEPQKVFIGRTVIKDKGEYALVDVYENRVYYSCGEHLESKEELEVFVRPANAEEIKKYENHILKLTLFCAGAGLIVILITILLGYNDNTEDY